MQCPQCNKDNPQSAKFCLKCGTKLVAVCPKCGTKLPPDRDTRFCVECGSELGALEPAAPLHPPESIPERVRRLIPKEYAERLLATRGQVPAERRMVTILFSDVEGSTAMTEHLDPEDVMEIMDGAFDVLIEPVFRYEGTLARLMGDAILAFFGAPIAHEDDPERAIRAALEIIDGAQRYAERLEQERGIKGFNVRVGINTGLVVVGEVGSDLRVEYTAMGDAINLAARMESAAEPGTLLITEDTHKLIAYLCETEALRPIEVKGKAEPVSVYRVLAAKAVCEKLRGIAGLESPLVGRQAEFAALREAIGRLQAGVGGIVTLVGEAGIGKSRLVAELRKQGSPGLQWMEGRCLSYGTSIAYLLWLDVLRSLLGMTLEDTAQAVAEQLRGRVQALCPDRFEDVYPHVAHLMSLPLSDEEQSQLAEMDGRELKDRIFQAVEMLLECAAQEQPLALVCEDLHWADATSIKLLEKLLALTDRVPLLLLCVFRPVKDHRSWRFRETVGHMHAARYTDLVLQPLSPVESQTLLSNLLRIEELPEVLRERILSRAEGNPFYVEEVIRSLMDSRAIEMDDATGGWLVTPDIGEIAIPDTLQGVLVARIDRLQEDTKRVLQMASVIGRIFLYRVLAEIAAEERRLDEGLATLQREEMIRERARIPELEYIFKHDLTREAAYNGLLKKRRRAFHRRVAEALERLFPERIEEQLGLLAHHWEQAGDAEKATEYLLRAGDQARLVYSHREAIGYYQRALPLLKAQGENERAASTWMKLGLTYHTAFDFQLSRQAYEEGFALWQRATQMEPAVLPPAPHALRVPWGNPPSLDPARTCALEAWVVIDAIFCGLLRIDREMNVAPDLAQRWEVSEGGRRYIFHLRRDARWSDGTPLTAADFEYAWKRLLHPATGSPAAAKLFDVKAARAFHHGEVSDPDYVGVRAADEHTLIVELEGPTGYFLQLLADTATFPVPRQVLEAHGEAWTQASNMVTNGPFKLEAWVPGESIVLVRNREYHGRFTGNVERVEIDLRIEWRMAAGLQMYEADRLDILPGFWGLSTSLSERARQRHADDYVSGPRLATNYLTFDVNRPPFDDPRVRQAFVMAIDRETLVNVDLRGYGFPAEGGLVPPRMPGHSADLALRYDPEGARQLLAEAGYPAGRGFPLVDALAHHSVGIVVRLRGHWQDNLGIDITWQPQNDLGFLERLRSTPPHIAFAGYSADYPDPDSFLRVAVRLHSAWRNEAYERLVEEARGLTDQAQRMELYRQADRILVEEAPILPLLYEREHLLVKPWVKRYPCSSTAWRFWKDVIIEPH